MERTLSLIKPDAVAKKDGGSIIRMIESNGFRIAAQKLVQLSKADAAEFYAVHKERGFFNELVDFMSSGPIIAQVLEKKNAVVEYRNLMGATNPQDAAEGTIRKSFAENIERNAVHGSDSLENAEIEIAFFFSKLEIIPNQELS